MTEEGVKDLLKEAYEKIKDDFIPSMTNLLMDVFQHGMNKGSELGMKVASDALKSKSQSVIKWQTGEPTESGTYIVTTIEGTVAFSYYQAGFSTDEEYFKSCIIAWCKLSDIEPYKEGTI